MKIVFRDNSKYGLALMIAFLLLTGLEGWLNSMDVYLIPPVENAIYCFYILGISVLVFRGFITFIKMSKREESSIHRISTVVTGLFYVYFVIALIGSLYTTILNNPLEKTENGYYRYFVETENPDILKAAYAKPYGPFAMKKVDIKAVINDEKTTKPNSEYTYESGEVRREKGFKAIFEKYFSDEKYSYQIDYDAKGFGRLLIYEDDKQIEFLLYDGVSEEEKIGTFLHCISPKKADGSWSIMEGEYVGTYLYNYETKDAYIEK